MVDEIDGFIIYLNVNGNHLTLSLDESTFNELTVNPYDTIPDYLQRLMHNNVIPAVNVQTLSFSIDNKDFLEIEVVQENDNDKDQGGWGEQATKLLLDKYETYLPLVGPLKKFKKKKNMWFAIAEDIKKILGLNRTATQCENRYKTVLKRKKNTIKKNRKTGESPERDPYEEQFSKIAAIDDSLEPAVKIGVGRCIIMNKEKSATQNPDEASKLSTPSTSSSSSRASTPSTRRKRSLSDVLYEIAKEKEEGRNRRHQEKLQTMRELAEKFFNKTE